MTPLAVTPGAEVRVHAGPAPSDIARGLRENAESSLSLEARWVELSDTELVLSVAGDEYREGLQTRTLRRRVVLDPSTVRRVEVRTLDRARTAALAAGLSAGVFWFIKNTFRVGEPGTPGSPPPTGEL